MRIREHELIAAMRLHGLTKIRSKELRTASYELIICLNRIAKKDAMNWKELLAFIDSIKAFLIDARAQAIKASKHN